MGQDDWRKKADDRADKGTPLMDFAKSSPARKDVEAKRYMYEKNEEVNQKGLKRMSDDAKRMQDKYLGKKEV